MSNFLIFSLSLSQTLVLEEIIKFYMYMHIVKFFD